MECFFLRKLTYPIQAINFPNMKYFFTDEEKLYIYYLNKACWAGSPILLFQASFESPALFIIFQNFFCSFKPFSDIKREVLTRAKKRFEDDSKNKNPNNTNESIPFVSDVDFKQFLIYAAKFYSNFGNFQLFRRKKFIPEIPLEKFELILSLSDSFNKHSKFIWDNIKYDVYDSKNNQLNLQEKNGKNSYYLFGINQNEINKIDQELKSKQISTINTRLMTVNKDKFAVLITSIEEKTDKLNDQIQLIYGEFGSFLKKVNFYLDKAKQHASNEEEKEMIDSYIQSFTTGDFSKLTENQKIWAKNNTSNIEMNIGWIDTEMDPLHVRGAYQAWVAISDKEIESKAENYSTYTTEFLSSLPWKEGFDELKEIPAEVLFLYNVCFACHRLPLSIVRPNYKEIQTEEGVKSIFFNNIYKDYNKSEFAYCSDNDFDLLSKNGRKANKIKVIANSLLNRIQPKLLRKLDDGSYNFDSESLINPITNLKVKTFYNQSETFEEKFDDLSLLLKQCRKDYMSLCFIFNMKIIEILNVTEKERNEIIYTYWLIHIRKAVLNLPLYNEQTKTWTDINVQSVWIFLNFILSEQTSGQELIKISLTEKGEIKIELQTESIDYLGQIMVQELLMKIQMWICTGDVASAKEFIEKYSNVNEEFLNIKKIISENELPQTLTLYHNFKLEDSKPSDKEDDTKKVSLVEYPETYEGIIESFVDRFSTDYNKDIYAQWVKYDINFFS